MPYSIMQVAKRLAKRSGWRLSNLQIQKMAYIASMVHAGRNGGAALAEGSFEAWDYGPVHPDLYHALKMFGADPVRSFVFRRVPGIDDSADRELIDYVHDRLGSLKPFQLVEFTHRDTGAWARHYRLGDRGRVIPLKDMVAEYQACG